MMDESYARHLVILQESWVLVLSVMNYLLVFIVRRQNCVI